MDKDEAGNHSTNQAAAFVDAWTFVIVSGAMAAMAMTLRKIFELNPHMSARGTD
jgi:hypothetical protein